MDVIYKNITQSQKLGLHILFILPRKIFNNICNNMQINASFGTS